MVIAHQVSGDPFGIHEFLLILAASGGIAIAAARVHIMNFFNRLRRAAVNAWLRIKGW
jgi:hypothetical protein